jgi:Haem-degrading
MNKALTNSVQCCRIKSCYRCTMVNSETNPLDFVPDEIPFDISYGPPISLHRAQAVISCSDADAPKRNWKLNVAVVDSGGNLVAFQRMDGAMLASIQIAEHKARARVCVSTARHPWHSSAGEILHVDEGQNVGIDSSCIKKRNLKSGVLDRWQRRRRPR